MKLDDDVMNDLMTIYLAGEASSATRAIVEARAREDATFAARLAAAQGMAVPLQDANPPGRDAELRALTETRQFIRLRTIFVAAAVFFSLLPLAVRGGDSGVEFVFLGRHDGLVWAFWSLAAASWSAHYVMHRRVRQAGL
jgi:hypothetical protein